MVLRDTDLRTVYGTVFTLRPYERGIQEVLGTYSRFVVPGPGFQLLPMDSEPQVDGVMWVRPTGDEESIKRTFYTIDNWKRASIQLARAGRIGKGVDIMVTKISNGKIKKTSRGMRKHVRRMKQESRKAGIPINELKKSVPKLQKPAVKKEA